MTGQDNYSLPDEYSFVRMTAGHYPLIQQLYSDVFNSKPSLKEIKKHFATTELGCDAIGFIAIHKKTNDIAAFYAIFPVKILIGDKMIQGGQAGDGMTHKDHRNKGLYFNLILLSFEECKRQGLKLLFGQPNKNSYPGLKKTGWRDMDEIVRWDLKLKIKTFPLAKLAGLHKAFFSFYLNYAKAALKKFRIKGIEEFNNPLHKNYARIFRDRNYLNYKKGNDKFFIKINGIVLWIRLTDVFWIGDLDNYESLTDDFLKKLRKIAFWLGYNTISFDINKTVELPPVLNYFKASSEQPSCLYYLDKSLEGYNILITAADFDTW